MRSGRGSVAKTIKGLMQKPWRFIKFGPLSDVPVKVRFLACDPVIGRVECNNEFHGPTYDYKWAKI